MVRLEKFTILMVIGISLSLLITGCSNKKAEEDIKSLKFGNSTITAGNQFRLSPVKYEPITISNTDYSVDFVFHCTLLSKETNIEYTGVVAFQTSDLGESQSLEKFEKWPSDITKKDITIPFFHPAGYYTYSGQGFFYFYLINKENQCISNIVRWAVKFV